MKIFFLLTVAVLAAFSSCTNDNDSLVPDILSETSKQALTFYATMEGGTATRATLSGLTPAWEEGDIISINGKTYVAQTASAATQFNAETEGQEAEGPSYNAYFPAALYDGTTAKLPATISETWADGQFNMPMYATSTDTDLAFKNLCGVLKITVKSSQLASVKSIKVSSSNCATSGEFSVNTTTYAAELTDASAISNTVTVTYSEAVETDAEGKVFYVAIPAQTYKNLRIAVSYETTTKVMTTQSGVDIIVERNKIYPITFVEDVHDYVEIGGKKWATMNLGATTVAGSPATCYGNYYARGEIEPRYTGITITGISSATFSGWKSEYSKGYSSEHPGITTAIDAEHDAATQAWGSPWRLPKPADFIALRTACVGAVSSNLYYFSPLNTSTPFGGIYWLESNQTYMSEYTGVTGLLFVDKEDPSKRVFFPAEGYASNKYLASANSQGYYWSSGKHITGYPLTMYFTSSSNSINMENYFFVNNYYGLPIRPVSD